jgi:hypothetical protein
LPDRARKRVTADTAGNGGATGPVHHAMAGLITLLAIGIAAALICAFIHARQRIGRARHSSLLDRADRRAVWFIGALALFGGSIVLLMAGAGAWALLPGVPSTCTLAAMLAIDIAAVARARARAPEGARRTRDFGVGDETVVRARVYAITNAYREAPLEHVPIGSAKAALPPLRTHRNVHAALLFVSGLALVGAWRWNESHSRGPSLRQQLTSAHAAVETLCHAASLLLPYSYYPTENCPTAHDVIAMRKLDWSLEYDPWGKPYEITCEKHEATLSDHGSWWVVRVTRTVTISSTGPDREIDTGDDIESSFSLAHDEERMSSSR